MDLVIDQGNTVCKLAIFGEGDELVDFQSCSELSVPLLLQIFKKFDIQAGILSSVKDLKPEISSFLKSQISNFIFLDHNTPLPLKNAYMSPQTLGLDRLAAAVGAWSIQPHKPLLIVDMGTAITYDFVREDGTYMGGNIAPGMLMRFNALNIFTDKLPLVEPKSDFTSMGIDTQSAILSGVMQGIVFEVDGYFDELRQKHAKLFASLTGGDLFYFDGKLKNSIFASKNLVLIGLNRILHYNVHS